VLPKSGSLGSAPNDTLSHPSFRAESRNLAHRVPKEILRQAPAFVRNYGEAQQDDGKALITGVSMHTCQLASAGNLPWDDIVRAAHFAQELSCCLPSVARRAKDGSLSNLSTCPAWLAERRGRHLAESVFAILTLRRIIIYSMLDSLRLPECAVISTS
jgi:hypothetical protein